tara:strand:- start:863 stop:1567 length:705 start_codon:yes stop_codon:yes gene_type:complete
MTRNYHPIWAIFFILLVFQITPLLPVYLLDSLGDWAYQNPVTVNSPFLGETEMYPIRDNLAGFFGMPIAILFILWRMKKRKISISTLGSLDIQKKPLFISIILLAVFLLIEEIYFYLLGIEMPESFIEFLLADPIFLSFISVVVVAPLLEEFLFRGFLYSQLKVSFLKEWGAVALSSLVWTALHFQYEIGILFFLFFFGLFLGYFRVKYNSLLIPVVLHMLNNLVAFLLIIYFP